MMDVIYYYKGNDFVTKMRNHSAYQANFKRKLSWKNPLQVPIPKRHDCPARQPVGRTESAHLPARANFPRAHKGLNHHTAVKAPHTLLCGAATI